MGTNFYIKIPEDCQNDIDDENILSLYEKHCDEEGLLHLGKRLSGWHFALRVYPEHGYCSLADIKHFLFFIKSMTGTKRLVTDEYGKWCTADEFIDMVQGWKGDVSPEEYQEKHMWFDTEYDKKNKLIMHLVNDGYCIGRHYDYGVSYFNVKFS